MQESSHERLGFFSTIRGRLNIAFLVIGLLPLLVISLVTYVSQRDALIDSALRGLSSVSQLEFERIQNTIILFDENLNTIATRESVVGDRQGLRGLSVLVAYSFQTSTAEYQSAKAAVQNDAGPFMSSNVVDLILLNRSGQVVYSYHGLHEVGSDESAEPWYGKAFTDIAFDEDMSANVITLTTPVINGDHNVGTLVMFLNGQLYSDILADRSVLESDSYESYIVNRDGLMITGSRFQENVILNQQVNTRGVNFARSVEDRTTVAVPEAYPDYRGVSVLGAVTPLHEFGWVLVSEIDESETLADLNSLVVANMTVVVFAGVFVLIVAYYVARQISTPIARLTETADAIASGDLNRQVPQIAGGEVGVLAKAFGKMSMEVRSLLSTMEGRIASRTADLETSSEIASAANQIREMDDLLSLTVNLVRDRFNFYYVQVYLLDPSGEWAVLKDGTGYVGRRLLVKSHRLPMNGRSLVARSIKSGELQIVQDVSEDPDFLPNELLPDTKSELTIPLRSQGAVIGVLDIQHSEVNPFDESGLQLFQTLADQLAVTFENVQLFQDTAKRSRELETVAEVSAEAASNLDVDDLLRTVANLTRDNFALYHAHIYLYDRETNSLVLRGGAGEVGLQMVAQGRFIPMDHPSSLVAKAARTLEGVIVNDVTLDPDFLPHELLPKTRAEMAVPMVVGDELIGVLDTQASDVDHFTEEDVRIKTILSAQIAVAVRNAYSFQQTQSALAETELLYNASERLAGASNYDELLMSLVNSTALQNLHRANIFIFDHSWTDDNPAETMTLATVWDGGGDQPPTPVGTTYSLAAFPIMAHIKPDEPFIVTDITTDERADEHTRAVFRDLLHMRMVVVYPMVVGDEWIGIIMGLHTDPAEMSIKEIRRIETLVDQVASLVQNIRLFDQTQKSLAQTERLYSASERIATVTTMQEVLEALIETTHLQNMDRANFMLFDRPWTLEEDPDKATIVATWEREGEPRSTVGTEYPFGAFPMLKLFEWGEPYVIADAENDPDVDEAMRDLLMKRLGMQSVVFYQLIVGGERIGFLTGQAATPSNWIDDDEIREIGLLVDQAATVIQNVRLFEQSQRRAAELATVAQVGTEVATSLDINEMLWTVVNITRERFGLYHVHIYLLGEDNENLRLTAGAGEIGRKMVARGYGIGLHHKSSLVAQAGRTHKSVISNDVRSADDFLPNPLLPETRSEMAIPLLVGDTLLGVLDVQSSSVGYFTEVEAQVQTTLASQIAVSLNNARLYTETQQQSKQLAEALQTARLAYWEFDLAAGHFLFNDGFYELIGTSIEEEGTYYMSPQDYSERFIPEEYAAVIGESVGIAAQTDDPNFEQEIESPIILPNGERRIFLVKVRVQMNAEGRVIKLIGANQDITERVEQQEEIRKRATELATVAQVGTEAATTLDVNEMLWTVSNLTRDRFNLYHAHIYLLDDVGENLVLSAGAGEAGRLMVKRGHSIPVNRETSLVASAARTRRSVISNNVTQAADFMANPLLPNTRSEMAIPLLVGNTLLGVLDVQSDVVGRFSESDVQIQMTLASQIAVAVNNARLYTETQQSQRFLRGVIDSTPDWILAKDRNFRYILVNEGYANALGLKPEDFIGKSDSEMGFPDELVFGNPEKGIVGFRHDDERVLAGEEIHNPYDVAQDSEGNPIILNTVKTPVYDAEGNVVGILAYARDMTEHHNQQEVIRQRARVSSILAQMTSELSQANDENDILKAVHPLLQEMGGSVAALAYYDTDENGEIGLAYVKSVMMGDGTMMPLDALPSSIIPREENPFADLILNVPNEVSFIEDQDNDPRVNDAFRAFTQASGFASSVVIPIKRGDEWLGILTLNTAEPTVFSNVIRELAQSLRPTVVSVVTSRLAFLAEEEARRESERRANELRTVADVSTTTTTILDLNTLLQSVTDLTKQSFGLYHAHIYLLDDSGENLVLAGGAGETGRKMRDRGHSIPMVSKNSLVARTARNREGIIANNVRDEAIFLPNPMLPDTRSEMAVPMVVGDELIGVLDVQSDQRDWFTEQYRSVLTLLAEQVSIAVRNAQAFDRERKTIARLKEVDRLKQQFLANMSHELRTPLNSIIGYAEVLLDGVDGDLTEDAVEDVEAIHDSGKHLLSIINEILDLAKIEAGQMQLDRKPLSLVSAVEEIVRSGQILVKDKPVELQMVQEDDVNEVFADQVRLRQIMWNLVSNAIKFTEEGSVTVRFGLHPEEENMTYVRIEDSGIGMTDEALEIIFERFRQADGSSTRRAGGTGLGLAITRQLVNMHGGEIYVESEPGVGSVFWFTMPLHVAETVQS